VQFVLEQHCRLVIWRATVHVFTVRIPDNKLLENPQREESHDTRIKSRSGYTYIILFCSWKISLYIPKLIKANMSIEEVKKISITILMDNSTDLLLKNSAHALRSPLIVNERLNLPPPAAEHGFSALISVTEANSWYGDTGSTFLFDTGVTENGVIHNAELFGVNFNNLDRIILSHGHFDHSTGLVNILKRISSQRSSTIDVFAHPDAFLRRWLVFPDGKKAKMPSMDEQQLELAGALIHKSDKITVLPNSEKPLLLITGQIPRKTNFEKGFPYQYVEKLDRNSDDGEQNLNLIPDPLVRDDQAIVVNLGKKGLIVLTGCGHAGVMNTINYAKDVTGVDKVCAIIGGFHLPADGGIYEEAIDPTIRELHNTDPEYIIPCHCTGLKATSQIMDLMPDKFIQSAVGTTFTF
jgi:7,8-dihydropterin-6-yl-methyl-4-(beta-D-ribofuranosyl)aminobenzene 5'-phosphate synthase